MKHPLVTTAREWSLRTKRRVLNEVAAWLATDPNLSPVVFRMTCWYFARRLFVERVIRA